MPIRDTFAFDSIDSTTSARTTVPRPQSYAAPRAWDMALHSRVQSPSRLGVLPSPTKEVFPQLQTEELQSKNASHNEQALLDSIVRHASPPPVHLSILKDVMKTDQGLENLAQEASAIALLPSQQQDGTTYAAHEDRDESEGISAALRTPLILQADAESDSAVVPQVEESSLYTHDNHSISTSAERLLRTQRENEDKANRHGSGSDFSPPVDALRPEEPARTHASSVSSIEPEESKNKPELGTSIHPQGFAHKRQVSAIDTEPNFSPEVKLSRRSQELTTVNVESSASNADTVTSQGPRLHSPTGSNQPSAEARHRALDYFARSIPDKPSGPPVHPALRDSSSQIMDRSDSQAQQRSGSQGQKPPPASSSEECRSVNAHLPSQSNKEHAQAISNDELQLHNENAEHPNQQPNARYGPFPPRIRDGSRQYAPHDISTSREIGTNAADAPQQQRPNEEMVGTKSSMQHQYPSHQRVSSPRGQPLSASNRHQLLSGDRPPGIPKASSQVPRASAYSLSRIDATQRLEGQHVSAEASAYSQGPVSRLGSSRQELQGSQQSRGTFRGPSNPTVSELDRPSAWESVGAQRLEVHASGGGYMADRPAATTIGPSDNSAQDTTLRRAATSSKTEGGKKKRFSLLGSLFNRSGSTGHTSKQSNKLTKANSSRRSQLLPTSPSVQQWAESSSAVGPARNAQYPNVPAPIVGPQGTESMIFNPEWQRNAKIRERMGQGELPPPGGYYAPSWAQESDHITPQSRIRNIQDSQENLYDATEASAYVYSHGNLGSGRYYGHSSPSHALHLSTAPTQSPPQSQSYGDSAAIPSPFQYPPGPKHRQSSASSYNTLQPLSQHSSSLTTPPPLDSHHS